MLTNKDINDKFNELLKKKENIKKVTSVIKEACSDLGIKIADNGSDQVPRIEELIEHTGQYRVLKNNYIETWNELVTKLKNTGYSDDVVACMTETLKFENWVK